MIDTRLIPSSDYVREVQEPNGNTQDIIDVIVQADQKNDPRFCAFAAQFKPTKAGLKKLWSFVRHKIKYKTDAFGTQDIKLPAALWKAKQGDCKSKTLFINQVLRCLGIGYIIRFVGFGNGDYTHVYSIAVLKGQYIPLDSVYEYFNKEAPYQRKKDYDMTRISTITGLKRIGEQSSSIDPQKLYEEIQQRKRYVTPMQPINFANVSEGKALLELLVQKLKILGAMNDKVKATSEQGINLVHNAIKTGAITTSIIPNELQGVAERINHYLKMNDSAVGHGIRGRALDFYKIKARNSHKVGSTPGASVPGMECLTNLWFLATGGSGTQLDPYLYRTYNNDLSTLGNYPCSARTLQLFQQTPNDVFFFYGRKTIYRSSFAQAGNDFANILNNFVASNPNLIQDIGYGQYKISNQATYDAMLEELKQKMPTLSNWAQYLYRADNSRPDGTVGSGMLYNFVPGVTQIAGISPNDFPSIVQTKMVFQRHYIDSCVNFSTISRTIFEDMSENGVLFDMGGRSPNLILSALLRKYDPNISLAPGVGELIVGLVVALLSNLPAIINACNNGSKDAKTIDNAAQDTANYKEQSQSTLPSALDFVGKRTNTGGGGSGNTGGSNNGNNNTGINNDKKKGSVLPLMLGAAGLLVATKKKRK